jgi:hypothetical protein
MALKCLRTRSLYGAYGLSLHRELCGFAREIPDYDGLGPGKVQIAGMDTIGMVGAVGFEPTTSTV